MGMTLDCCDPESLSVFWAATLGYSVRGPFGPYWPLVPHGESDEPWFVLQRVGEARSGKNRMHLDVEVADIEAEALRLEALGARRMTDEPVVMGPMSWYVMADPEENEFCILSRPA
jgi:predicted enzyme related to lactoylglutathione lyase